MLLLAGITIGILFNPLTGPQTRKWIADKVLGGGDYDYDYAATTPPATTNSGSTTATATSASEAS
jgi:hypothetical protein